MKPPGHGGVQAAGAAVFLAVVALVWNRSPEPAGVPSPPPDVTWLVPSGETVANDGEPAPPPAAAAEQTPQALTGRPATSPARRALAAPVAGTFEFSRPAGAEQRPTTPPKETGRTAGPSERSTPARLAPAQRDATPPPATRVPRHPTERYGTALEFVCDPAEAGERSRDEGKLLFVLHLSGNFENTKFT